jgi:hypothetical protein
MTHEHTQQKFSQPKNLQALDIFKCYQDSKYLSVKHSSYFQVYEELLSKYKNRKITFVEVGVLNGGSLFMWRKFFGPEARIIGIDLNPLAKKWEADGFEIYIGSQSDGAFWDRFFSSVGDVDVIVDDGGHTNEQQIVTVHKAIPHIKNAGMLIVEDVHSSYSSAFGNPSRYSFINYSKHLIDSINSRFSHVNASNNPLSNAIYSISIYESIVCFKIDREKCFVNSPVSNNGISVGAEDFRYRDGNLGRVAAAKKMLASKLNFLEQIPSVKRAAKIFFRTIYYLHYRSTSFKLKKYFS